MMLSMPGIRTRMSQRAACISIFILLFCAYAYIHQIDAWNHNSRMDALHALVVRREMNIDVYEKNTGDKAFVNGHFYSDKAPGIFFLAIPSFAAASAILTALHINVESSAGWFLSSWLTVIGSVGMLAAVGGAAFYSILCDWISRRLAFMATVFVFLGAAPFPYATTLFSHSGALGLLTMSLWMLLKRTPAHDAWARNILRYGLDIALVGTAGVVVALLLFAPMNATRLAALSTLIIAMFSVGALYLILGRRISSSRHLLAGLLAGFAAISEYPAAIAAAGFLALAWEDGRRGAICFVGGIAIPVGALLIYNAAVFGSPFSIGYMHTVFTLQNAPPSLLGFALPSPSKLSFLLFSPMRGLFYWSPFLLLAFIGIRDVLARSKFLGHVLLVTIAAHTLAISAHLLPGGGFALGPRHLAPIVPLLGFFAGSGLRRLPRTGAALGALSIGMTTMATLVSVMPPERIKAPLVDFYLPRLAAGALAPNLGRLLGFSPLWSVGVFVFALVAGGWWIWKRIA